MGKIADAIEEVEQELEELREENKVLELRCEDFEVNMARLKKILEEFEAMEDYIEANHPEIITAFEVANRLEG